MLLVQRNTSNSGEWYMHRVAIDAQLQVRLVNAYFVAAMCLSATLCTCKFPNSSMPKQLPLAVQAQEAVLCKLKQRNLISATTFRQRIFCKTEYT